MNDRLSRSEIKNDEVLEVLDRLLIFGRDHWQKLVGGILAVIVVLLGFWGYSLHQGRQNTLAQVDLSKALMIAGAPIDPQFADPADPDDPSFPDEFSRATAARPLFEAVLASWPGRPAAITAEMFLAEQDVESGDTAAAEARWERVASSGSRNASVATAEMNLIRLQRSLGRLEDSRSRLEAQLDRKDSSLPQDLVLSELATTLEELGDDENATATYRRLVEEHPTSSLTFQAQRKLADSSL